MVRNGIVPLHTWTVDMLVSERWPGTLVHTCPLIFYLCNVPCPQLSPGMFFSLFPSSLVKIALFKPQFQWHFLHKVCSQLELLLFLVPVVSTCARAHITSSLAVWSLVHVVPVVSLSMRTGTLTASFLTSHTTYCFSEDLLHSKVKQIKPPPPPAAPPPLLALPVWRHCSQRCNK